MKRPKSQSPHSPQFPDAQAPDPKKTPSAPVSVSTVRTTPRDFINPIDYQHPYDSMARFARALSLRYVYCIAGYLLIFHLNCAMVWS